MFLYSSTDFTPPCKIPLSSAALEFLRFKCSSKVELWYLTSNSQRPSTNPLRPIIPGNACPLRITATAGTKLAGTFHLIVSLFLKYRVLQQKSLRHSRGIAGSSISSLSKIPYCWLCKKSLDLVSVPVWLIILSEQLRIEGLVSHYLTNNLILQKLILKRIYPFISAGILFRAKNQMTFVLLTRLLCKNI
jgi:hypothetical protein